MNIIIHALLNKKKNGGGSISYYPSELVPNCEEGLTMDNSSGLANSHNSVCEMDSRLLSLQTLCWLNMLLNFSNFTQLERFKKDHRCL